MGKKQIIRLTENDLHKIIRMAVNESIATQEKEQMLTDLFKYLSQESTDDIYDGGKYGKSYINTQYKAYNYFEPKEIVHNAWAVHFTNVNAFEGILKDGFKLGTADLDKLAYSADYYDTRQKTEGWNFALPIDNKYLGEDLGYGDCAFLIKTDGVRAYHKGDGDDEIIFKNCMVKEKIPFAYDEDYDCWILYNYEPNKENNKLPEGSYYEEELGMVVFEDIHPLIKFATANNNKTFPMG